MEIASLSASRGRGTEVGGLATGSLVRVRKRPSGAARSGPAFELRRNPRAARVPQPTPAGGVAQLGSELPEYRADDTQDRRRFWRRIYLLICGSS